MKLPGQSPDDSAKHDAAERAGEAVRARLARIFGEDAPTSTRDDLPEPETHHSEDQWYLENRPPHHEG